MVALIARIIQTLTGWSIVGNVPALNKFVIVIAPHTSKWDWFHLMLAGLVLRQRFRYLIKGAVYDRYAFILRWTGAIAVRNGQGMTQAAVDEIKNVEHIRLALSPEGKLPRVEYWHTGFYHIAEEAAVPIVPVYADYANKVVGIGTPFYPSGDIHEDMRFFHTFYAGITAKHPEQFGPVQVGPQA